MRRLLTLFLLAAGVCLAQEQSGSGGGEDSLGVWRWVNFGILAIGIIYLLAKYMPPFFRTRTAAIQKDIAEAQQAKHDSEQRAAAIDKRVAGLGAEIEAFRVQSRAEMEREGERIRQETAALIRKIHDQAQGEIESAGKAARREVRLYAANLALDLAAQRIRGRLDEKTEAGLFDNFIGDLKREESNN
jgi:F-type H+-transporting ATPase subunit b